MKDSFLSPNTKRNEIKTILMCAVIGPPAGSIFLILAWSLQRGEVSQFITAVKVLPLIFALSYFLGGLQAILTGMIYSLVALYRHLIPWWAVMLGATVPYLGWILVYYGYDLYQDDKPQDFGPILMLCVHSFAALVCWLFSRNFWTRPNS
jgi:uncharacterized BrkB/YihY/UPF0761 family membrane protein